MLNNENLEYCTIGVHRSSLSVYHTCVYEKPVDQHSFVCFLIPEILNLRPPQPKYTFAWDVQVVLDYIKSKWGCTSPLSDNEINLKLCMLLALTTSSMASSLHCPDISYMVNAGDKVTFYFDKLHESWRKGNAFPSPSNL